MKIFPHQKKIIDFIDDYGIVLADMGSGKTLATLVAMQKFDGVTLIVAPINVAKTVWAQEAEKWNLPILISRLVGTAKQRLAALNTKADAYVINVENLQWLEKQNFHFDNLIIDELSMFKSLGQRYKALVRMSKKCKRRIGLTGTPVANSLIDLWAQVNIIMGRDNNPLARTKTGYTQKYFYPIDYMGYQLELKPGVETEIFEKMKSISVRVEGAELPDLMVQDINVDIPMDYYNDLKKDFCTDEITVANAAVMVGKLQQVAQGQVYDDDGDLVHIHDVKQQALVDMVDTLQGEPVIVVYHYKHDLDCIMSAIPKAVKFSPDKVDAWNNREIPVMAMQVKSGSHGLNLQKGGHHLIWYSLTYSHESYAQMNARLHRTGQDNGVIVHRIVAVDTIDEAIIEALSTKKSLQQMLLEYLNA